MSQEIMVVIEKRSDGSFRIDGCATGNLVHRLGLLHTTVLLIPVTGDKEPMLLLHKRSPDRWISPGLWDVCGGHMAFDEKYFMDEKWKSDYNWEQAALDTAIREANEEIAFEPTFIFSSFHVQRFKPFGYFECRTTVSPTKQNNECSTAYFVLVPKYRTVTICDDDPKGDIRQLEVKKFTVSELFDSFKNEPGLFADGIWRILNKVSESEFKEFCMSLT